MRQPLHALLAVIMMVGVTLTVGSTGAAPPTAAASATSANEEGTTAIPDVPVEAVDTYVREQLDVHGMPGLALVVIDDGEVVMERGYGVADPDGTPVTVDTPFVLASVSKQLVGLTVSALVAEGRLERDRPVHDYIPWFGDGDDAHSRITAEHLLGHTSGFSPDQGFVGWTDRTTGPDALERVARELAQVPLATEPGERLVYSNANYDLLGHLVEVVTDRPYDEALAELVLEPLGMDRTSADQAVARENGLAQGYYPWFGLEPRPTDGAWVDGSTASAFTVSTARDLTRLVHAHLDSAASDADAGTGLDPAVLDTARQPLSSFETVDTLEHASGLWVTPLWQAQPDPSGELSPDLPTAYLHDGAMPTYRSYVLFVPEHDLGVVALANSGDVIRNWTWWDFTDGLVRTVVSQPPLGGAEASSDWLRTNSTTLLYGLPLLQVLLVAAALVVRRRVLVVLAAVVSVLALAVLLVVTPAMGQVPVRALWLAAPDVAVMTGMSVVAAVVLVAAVVWRARRGGRERQQPTEVVQAQPAVV